jgi:hypothetical protein
MGSMSEIEGPVEAGGKNHEQGQSVKKRIKTKEKPAPSTSTSLIRIYHGNRAALFTEAPHRPGAVGTSGTGDTKLRYL